MSNYGTWNAIFVSLAVLLWVAINIGILMLAKVIIDASHRKRRITWRQFMDNGNPWVIGYE